MLMLSQRGRFAESCAWIILLTVLAYLSAAHAVSPSKFFNSVPSPTAGSAPLLTNTIRHEAKAREDSLAFHGLGAEQVMDAANRLNDTKPGWRPLRVVWELHDTGCGPWLHSALHYIMELSHRARSDAIDLAVLTHGGKFCSDLTPRQQEKLFPLWHKLANPGAFEPIDIWISNRLPNYFPGTMKSHTFFPGKIGDHSRTVYLHKRPRIILGRPGGWGETVLPEQWKEGLPFIDELLVGSTFEQKLFRKHGWMLKDRTSVVPHCVDTIHFNRMTARELDLNKLGVQLREYNFLYRGGLEARKGWDVALKAYCKAFDHTEPVSLTMYFQRSTVHNMQDDSPSEQQFFLSHKQERSDISFIVTQKLEHMQRNGVVPATCPPISIVTDAEVPYSLLPGLYKAMNGVVLPFRAEGWAHGLLEGMAMGLPVAATNWSSPAEYMTSENSIPIPVQHLRDDFTWTMPDFNPQFAEPNAKQLQAIMRFLYSHPAEGAKVGTQARYDAETYFSAHVVADAFQRLLLSLARRHRLLDLI